MRPTEDDAYLIFRAQGGSVALGEIPSSINGLQFTVWRPGMTRVSPYGQPLRNDFLRWALHYAGVFRSRQYSVLIVRDGQRIVHHSCVMPAWFRWPFMEASDIQISDTWTEPDQRGRGIATFAAKFVVARADPDQGVWYVTREFNEPSVHVSQAVGMRLMGTAFRRNRMGLRSMGTLVIRPPR